MPQPPNGNAVKVLVAVVGLLLGALSGVTGSVLFMSDANSHVRNREIHESTSDKERRIRTIIDREVTPQLNRMEDRLVRIENKLDER